MAFTDISYEEIQSQEDFSNLDVTSTEKNDKSLNPPVSRGFQNFDRVVYYKNPLVQLIAVLCFGTPLAWMLISAFSPPKQPEQTTVRPPKDSEKEKLQQALEEERAKNQKLLVENALQAQRNQEIEVIDSDSQLETDTSKNSKESVATKPVEVTPISISQPQSQPIVRRVRPEIAAEVLEENVEPEIDPMERWMASANRGHYVTAVATNNTLSSSTTLVSNNSPTSKTENANEASLYSDAQIKKRLNYIASLYKARKLKERLASPSNYSLRTDNNLVVDRLPREPNESKRRVDVGSTAAATLESDVVWTNESRNLQTGEKKYLLELREGLKNLAGEEILPAKTKVTAVVTEYSSSGLLFMEVAEIINGSRRIVVPSGAMIIEGKNGSPLKAELKQEGNSNFAADLGSIIAPGVEEAFDSLSNSADSLVFEEGDRTLLRSSSSNESPLASGISGVARGTGETLNRRFQNRSNSPASAYFHLKAGETVRLVVYQDFSY